MTPAHPRDEARPPVDVALDDAEVGLLDHEREARAKRAQRSRARRGIGLNLVAMIDVVFLLLIYFLLTTNFTIGEEVYHLDLPEELRGRESDPFDLPDEPIIVRVDSIGPSRTDYRVALDFETETSVRTAPALYRFLNSHRADADNPAGIFLPDNPILIQPTRTTRWEHAVNVFNACLRARYTHVRFVEAVE